MGWKRGEVTIHGTAPIPHAPEWQSVWPALGAAGALLAAVGLTVSLPVALLGLALLAWAGVAAAVEVRRERRRAPPPPQGPGSAWSRRSKEWWGAVGIALVGSMLLIGVLRAFVAHDLLRAEAWPPPVPRPPRAVAAALTIAMLASGATAWRASRALVDARPLAARRALAATTGLGLAFLTGHALALGSLLRQGFAPWTGEAGSAFYALVGLHAIFAVGGLSYVAIAWHRVREGASWAGAAGPARGHVAFWFFVVGAWLVVYAIVYAGVVSWPGWDITPEPDTRQGR